MLKTVVCDDCGRLVNANKASITMSECICHACLEENGNGNQAVHCNQCGKIVSRDEAYYNDNGFHSWFDCEDCIEGNTDNVNHFQFNSRDEMIL